MSMKIGLQLYTLRNEMEKDFIGILKQVAEIGYEGVEFAGYGGLSAAELKKLLDELGLEAAGSHVGTELLKSDLQGVISYNKEIGSKYIVCPFQQLDTKEELAESIKFFNQVGEECKKNGLQFCYHNHSHEFKKVDGEYILDTLFKETDPQLVMAELDTYWVQYAGIDPVEYMKKFAERCPVVHQKDMDATSEKGCMEIGEGIMDVKAIFDESLNIKAEWFIVEQDTCKGSALESVKLSFSNLKKIIKA